MTFDEILTQVRELLQRQGRVSYRALKRRFGLDDDYLEDLKVELIKAQRLAIDEDGEVLVWQPTSTSLQSASLPDTPVSQATQSEPPVTGRQAPDAERRQLTVMFCDLADSTRLSGQLDPEDLRGVIRAYQAACVGVIQRFAGYVAQYLGDGLLVYFGYPQAHEDDAQRAVRTGLGILEVIGTLHTRLVREQGIPLAVRIGIHTGLVVVGEMGSGGRHEHLALGDTPNFAARLQSLATPATVVISAATARLVQGYFTCQDLGTHLLKGIDTPVHVYQVVEESAAQSRLDVAGATGLTPLVGREAEVTLLRQRWAQSTEGLGQVVVISGEAGIGKSRLVRVLTEQVVDEITPRLTLRCSPYHTNSAFYPIIEHLRRLLQWQRDTPPEATLTALEQVLQTTGLPLAEVVPLVAALLAVPLPARYPPLILSPQRQKQKTQEALMSWLLADAAQQPVLAVWEDLHWADPSTLELPGLLLDQAPTTRLLLVLTCRPEFQPPWARRSYMAPLTLTRLTRTQVEEMVLRVTGGKPLPAEVVQQIVAKTDGIPLFVEELVKTILEVGLLWEEAECYILSGPLPSLVIPATLQDALMARLDRLGAAKGVAQLGATIGRQFAYELLQAVSLLDEAALQRELGRLVEAELLYQRGTSPQATYTFKHALIQDAAYQSLLRSTRQQYHQCIAQVLEAQFPDIVETQPELLAHHYTEAGLSEQAVDYWQRAGERSNGRSAYGEAVTHCTRGLAVLQTLPDTPTRAQRELDMQLTLSGALLHAKGYAVPERGHALARAHELCQQVGDSARLCDILSGLSSFAQNRGEFQTSRELAEQSLTLAQRLHDSARILRAHCNLGSALYVLGELAPARTHLEQVLTLTGPNPDAGQEFRVFALGYASLIRWTLGYPDQALTQSHEMLTYAQGLSHPFTLARALLYAARLHELRQEGRATQERAAALVALATEQGFAQWIGSGTSLGGWAIAVQGQHEEGLAQMHQGLAAAQAAGEVVRSGRFARLAAVYGVNGQAEAGLRLLAEAPVAMDNTGEDGDTVFLYRVKGELLLRQAAPDMSQAEACFQQALIVARRQQAKSLELRTALSLARLWQQQGKRAEAYELLAPIYGWFTEGFDTVDL
jgi:class 3 adenylate cyclase/predicted ATPase